MHLLTRSTLAFVLALGFVGCDSDDTNDADVVDFRTTANASQTVPQSPDRGKSAVAEFRLNEARTQLSYTIQFTGIDIGAIKGDPQTEDTSDDLTKLHIHNAPAGTAGAHVFNIYGGPIEDDADMTFDAEAGIIRGVWDDSDLNTDLPEEAQTRRLTDTLDELCAGNTYLNGHTPFFDSGELRGQISVVSTVCDN